jgi:hypothetical protein
MLLMLTMIMVVSNVLFNDISMKVGINNRFDCGSSKKQRYHTHFKSNSQKQHYKLRDQYIQL